MEMRDIYRRGPPYLDMGPFSDPDDDAVPMPRPPPPPAPTATMARGPLGMPYAPYEQEPEPPAAAQTPSERERPLDAPSMFARYPAPEQPYNEPAPAIGAAAPTPRGTVSPAVAEYVQRRAAAAVPKQPSAPVTDQDPNSTARMLDAIFSGMAGKDFDTEYWTGLDKQRREQAMAAKKEALAEQARDPNSAMSRSRQLMYRDYLKKSGLSDEEIGSLSAADLEKYKPGGAVDPMMMELRRRSLELREKGLETAAEKEERLNRQWSEMNTPGTEAAQRAEDIAVRGGLDPEVARGKTAVELARLSSAVNEYFKNTGAIGAARTGQAARTAGAVVEAQMPGKVETAYKTAEAVQPLELEKIRAAQTAKIEGEREAYYKPVPGLIIDDANAFRNASGDDVTRRKISDSASAYRTLMTSLDAMERLREQHGAKLPGDVQGEYESNKTLAIGAITTLGATGVLNEGEYQRYSKMIPGITPSLLDLPNLLGMDIKLDQIRGVKRALRGTVDAKLYQWGARYDYDSLPGAQPKPPKAAPTREEAQSSPIPGEAPAFKPRKRPRAGRGGEIAPGAGPGNEDLPTGAKPIGKRGGKGVRAIKTGTAPDGKRVRVIFYMDGSQEVVSG